MEQVTESTLKAKKVKSPCGSSICYLMFPPSLTVQVQVFLYRLLMQTSFHSFCVYHEKQRLQMLITNIFQLFCLFISGFTCGEKSTLHLLVVISLCRDPHSNITSEAHFLASWVKWHTSKVQIKTSNPKPETQPPFDTLTFLLKHLRILKNPKPSPLVKLKFLNISALIVF